MSAIGPKRICLVKMPRVEGAESLLRDQNTYKNLFFGFASGFMPQRAMSFENSANTGSSK